MKNSFIVLFILSVILASIASAYAAYTDNGSVMLGGYMLFRMRCPSARYSISQRASLIQRRANDLLTVDGIDMSKVKVMLVGKDAAIYVDGSLLVTIDECTAKANGTTPIRLANIWANRLKKIYPLVQPKDTMNCTDSKCMIH